MKRRFFAAIILLMACIGGTACDGQQAPATETIILIRHGEKTTSELGQLNIRGLNRSLALPQVLIGKYGKPTHIFAPDPADDISTLTHKYAYIRPLATIEPTAIYLGMPVNCQIGFLDIHKLQTELAKPQYAKGTIFIAWEHGMEDLFAKDIMATYSGSDSMVPDWPGNDYDSIFVIRITRSDHHASATFTKDTEGLNDKLTDSFPGPARSGS
jgi:hypothetical protein